MAVFFFFFELIYEKFDDSLFLLKKRWKGDLLILTFSGFFIFYFLHIITHLVQKLKYLN